MEIYAVMITKGLLFDSYSSLELVTTDKELAIKKCKEIIVKTDVEYAEVEVWKNDLFIGACYRYDSIGRKEEYLF